MTWPNCTPWKMRSSRRSAPAASSSRVNRTRLLARMMPAPLKARLTRMTQALCRTTISPSGRLKWRQLRQRSCKKCRSSTRHWRLTWLMRSKMGRKMKPPQPRLKHQQLRLKTQPTLKLTRHLLKSLLVRLEQRRNRWKVRMQVSRS